MNFLNFWGKKKKIGLIGWWGGQNEGDRYILETLEMAFCDDFKTIAIQTPFEPDGKTLNKLNKLDFLIIGGGGLFTLTPPYPFDTFNRWGSSLKTPFGFLGVGIQEINQKYHGVMKELLNRSTFFIVRDTGSFDIIKKYSSNILKVPDLTFLYLRKIQRKKTNSKKIGINLRIWDFDKVRTYDNKAWCGAINKLPYEKEKIPLSFLHDFDDRVAMNHIVGTNNSTFDMRLYEEIEVMIGMRLHSLIFAVQNSIPIVGIAYTPKIRRFFAELGLEEFCLDVNQYDELGTVLDKALANKEDIKEALNRYTIKSYSQISECIETITKDIIKK